MDESLQSLTSQDEGTVSDSDSETEKDIEMQRMVAKRVLKTLDSEELVNVPVNKLRIDWENIKIGGLAKHKLKKIWMNILRKERLYMNTLSVLGSFLENPHKTQPTTVQSYNEAILSKTSQVGHTFRHEGKVNVSQISGPSDIMEEDKKSSLNLDLFHKQKKDMTKEEKKELREQLEKYPAKPPNGYQIFSKQLCANMRISVTEVGTYWKNLSETEKEEYTEKARQEQQEYLSKLEDYIEKNPEDMYGKELFEKAAKLYSKTSRKTDKPVKDAPKRKQENGPVVPSSSSVDETDFSSPSPKKQKKHKRKSTGFDIYKERKQEEVAVENPELDKEALEKKLLKKYNKLSDTKKEKYEKLAEERNEEQS